MGARTVFAVLLLGCLPVAVPSAAAAQARCERDRAESALRELDAAVRALAPGGDAEPVRAQLQRLLADPCFRRAAEASSLPRFETATSARAWWAAGGGSWLWQYLHPATAGERPAVILPPDELPALFEETAPRNHPLRPLLCSVADEACGRETAGWAVRAEQAFGAHRVVEESTHGDGDRPRGRDALLERCRREAVAEPESRRYATWYGCVDAALPRETTFPLGRFRAPTRGWLVLRGRRGHYSFCDEVRAYHLTTGTAWIASSCGGLQLRGDGSVDFAATDQGRRGTVVTGRLPVDALREAAWMILMKDHTEESARRHAEYVPLPAGIEPRRSDDLWLHEIGLEGWFSSAQTTLGWSWVDGGRVLAEGTLLWPDSYHAAENHAASLLRIAEAGLTEGCPSAALPRRLGAGRSRGAVSSLDGDPNALRRVDEALLERLRAHHPPARCEGSR